MPGLAGSFNWEAIFLCRTSNLLTPWTSWILSNEIYDPIIAAIPDTGMTPLPFYYDWRKDPRDNALKLKQFIESKTVPGEKVFAIGHSMGGLVIRAYLEAEQSESGISKFISVGSPHLGAADSYPTWSAGQVWGNTIWKLAATIIEVRCWRSGYHGISDKEIFRSVIPSVQTLLPSFKFLRDKKSDELKTAQFSQNPWLPNGLFQLPIPEVYVAALYGTGQQTLSEIPVKDANRAEQILGIWQDGKPVGKTGNTVGDGTVLALSALIPDAINRQANLNHIDLIKADEGISEIFNLLGLQYGVSDSEAKNSDVNPTSMLAIISGETKFSMVDSDGRIRGSEQGLIAISDPKDGIYTLTLEPADSQASFTVIQILPNDKILWREYDQKSGVRSTKKLNFNRVSPREDILVN
ncbi:hypothetical protein A2Z33_04725 [Candidatus Gottesmanbacteria bacterium RBG_16_52_11]|uniref:DUF676 domain-containing protein n=1 Tax=Candidatus Gottesmanbacteria bacterium RBG_16_52_11 TaxID=1798374 RepID=A0A1F5YUJ3_9BACT|nr:MAG: hypothetical protein A2Z33_04725 [Candidatus Gottesmanbacteria bacterium RBG_16_52_11]